MFITFNNGKCTTRKNQSMILIWILLNELICINQPIAYFFVITFLNYMLDHFTFKETR